MSEFAKQLQTLSGRIVEALQEKPRESPAAAPTALELRLRLKTSLSQLYLALGMLIQEGRVRATPEGLTYRIRLSPESSLDSVTEDKTLAATLKT